jgi:hypothetical protein
MDEHWISAQFLVGGKRFLSTPQYPNQLWGPPCLLYNGQRGFFPWGNADHSHPCSAEVINVRSYNSTTPYIFMMWCLIQHKDNFTFGERSHPGIRNWSSSKLNILHESAISWSYQNIYNKHHLAHIRNGMFQVHESSGCMSKTCRNQIVKWLSPFSSFFIHIYIFCLKVFLL